MTVVPRLVIGAGDWAGTRICVPSGAWQNVLTRRPVGGGAVDVHELWREFPVALLERTA
jgi:maltooligosyltrehalose synthase